MSAWALGDISAAAQQTIAFGRTMDIGWERSPVEMIYLKGKAALVRKRPVR